MEEEKNLNDFIILENIIISKEELNDSFDLIKKFENILKEVEDLILKIDKNFINELSYKNFIKRNILLINFCKNFIKFNENIKIISI